MTAAGDRTGVHYPHAAVPDAVEVPAWLKRTQSQEEVLKHQDPYAIQDLGYRPQVTALNPDAEEDEDDMDDTFWCGILRLRRVFHIIFGSWTPFYMLVVLFLIMAMACAIVEGKENEPPAPWTAYGLSFLAYIALLLGIMLLRVVWRQLIIRRILAESRVLPALSAACDPETWILYWSVSMYLLWTICSVKKTVVAEDGTTVVQYRLTWVPENWSRTALSPLMAKIGEYALLGILLWCIRNIFVKIVMFKLQLGFLMNFATEVSGYLHKYSLFRRLNAALIRLTPDRLNESGVEDYGPTLSPSFASIASFAPQELPAMTPSFSLGADQEKDLASLIGEDARARERMYSKQRLLIAAAEQTLVRSSSKMSRMNSKMTELGINDGSNSQAIRAPSIAPPNSSSTGIAIHGGNGTDGTDGTDTHKGLRALDYNPYEMDKSNFNDRFYGGGGWPDTAGREHLTAATQNTAAAPGQASLAVPRAMSNMSTASKRRHGSVNLFSSRKKAKRVREFHVEVTGRALPILLERSHIQAVQKSRMANVLAIEWLKINPVVLFYDGVRKEISRRKMARAIGLDIFQTLLNFQNTVTEMFEQEGLNDQTPSASRLNSRYSGMGDDRLSGRWSGRISGRFSGRGSGRFGGDARAETGNGNRNHGNGGYRSGGLGPPERSVSQRRQRTLRRRQGDRAAASSSSSDFSSRSDGPDFSTDLILVERHIDDAGQIGPITSSVANGSIIGSVDGDSANLPHTVLSPPIHEGQGLEGQGPGPGQEGLGLGLGLAIPEPPVMQRLEVPGSLTAPAVTASPAIAATIEVTPSSGDAPATLTMPIQGSNGEPKEGEMQRAQTAKGQSSTASAAARGHWFRRGANPGGGSGGAGVGGGPVMPVSGGSWKGNKPGAVPTDAQVAAIAAAEIRKVKVEMPEDNECLTSSFLELFMSPTDVKQLLHFLDPGKLGKITGAGFQRGVMEIYSIRKQIVHSVAAQDEIISTFKRVCQYVLTFILILIFLIVLGVNTSTIIMTGVSCLTAAGLVLSFLYTDFVQSIILLVFLNPYRIGDRVRIDGETQYVKRITTYFSEFESLHGKPQYIAHKELISKKIVNESRCKSACTELSIQFSDNTTPSQYEALRTIVEAYVNSRPLEFIPDSVFMFIEGIAPSHFIQISIWVSHTDGWANYWLVRTSESSLFHFIMRQAKVLGMYYHLPVQRWEQHIKPPKTKGMEHTPPDYGHFSNAHDPNRTHPQYPLQPQYPIQPYISNQANQNYQQSQSHVHYEPDKMMPPLIEGEEPRQSQFGHSPPTLLQSTSSGLPHTQTRPTLRTPPRLGEPGNAS